MSSAELKMEIIRLIDQVEDRDRLLRAYQQLYSILGFDGVSEEDQRLQESLEIALKEVEEGKTTPHDQVMADIRQKYGFGEEG